MDRMIKKFNEDKLVSTCDCKGFECNKNKSFNPLSGEPKYVLNILAGSGEYFSQGYHLKQFHCREIDNPDIQGAINLLNKLVSENFNVASFFFDITKDPKDYKFPCSSLLDNLLRLINSDLIEDNDKFVLAGLYSYLGLNTYISKSQTYFSFI